MSLVDDEIGRSDMNVAVIGAGTMGSGIAQVCATEGHEVLLCDVSPDQLERGTQP